MADTTPKGFRFPQDSDAPNIAVDIENLATDVDTELDDYLTTASAASTYLTTASASSDYIAKSIVTTQGDLITASGSATPTRLAIGTAGQVLTVNSGATAPEWGTISSGGMTELASGNLTGITISITSIPNTYNELWLYLNGISLASGNSAYKVEFNSITTSDYVTFALNSDNPGANVLTTAAGFRPNTPTSGLLDSDTTMSAVLRFINYKNTAAYKTMQFTAFSVLNSGPTSIAYNGAGWQPTTAAISSLQLEAFGSGFDAGTYALYGVK
jgi:hypothetical protein